MWICWDTFDSVDEDSTIIVRATRWKEPDILTLFQNGAVILAYILHEKKVSMSALAIFLGVWLWWLNNYDIQETTNAFKPSASIGNIMVELLRVDAHIGQINVTFVQKAEWHFFPMLGLLEGHSQSGMDN